MAPTRLARSCSMCGSEARLSSSTSFMPPVPQVPGPAAHASARLNPCKNCFLVQRADESLAAEPGERLRQLGDRQRHGARDIGVDLVVLLRAPPGIEGDLGDEKLAREAPAVDMVGEARLVLDHEPVQLRLAAEYRVHPGLGADRTQARVDTPIRTAVCFAPLRHSVTISPIPRAGA